MIYILILFTFADILITVYLNVQYAKAKFRHKERMSQMKSVISSLQEEQLRLKERINIADNSRQRYLNHLNTVNSEMIELQKVSLRLLSEANNH